MRGAIDGLDAYIGGRVRLRRVFLGLSQEALGAKVELTFQQVQKYENGKNRVSGSMLVRIARALTCTPAYFFEGLEDSTAAPAESFSAEALRLARRFDAITDPYVKEIMVRTLGAFERAPAREPEHA